MIKAVIFDVDGVLVDSFEANLKFFQDLFKYVGHNNITRAEFKDMFHMTMTDVIRKVTKLEDENEIKKIWQMGKDRVVPYPSELITSPENYDKVLEELHNKYDLGIVTSRIRGGVFKLPQLAKFENHFKAVVYYEDTTKHKPHPEPLLLGVEKLGLRPGETVYIGDTEVDVQAAKAAGTKIVIYSKEELIGADKSTSLFAEIPYLVETL